MVEPHKAARLLGRTGDPRPRERWIRAQRRTDWKRVS